MYDKPYIYRCNTRSTLFLTILVAAQVAGTSGVGTDSGGSVVHLAVLVRAFQARADHL